jgi:trk system potassium uptake protein TrkH
MNLRAVARMLGIVLVLVAGFQLVPAAVGLVYGERDAALHCAQSALTSGLLGALVAWVFRGTSAKEHHQADYFRREGLATVGLSWLVVGVAGALPYLFHGTFHDFVDAFFESVSGFTTTGSTVLTGAEIEALPRALSFWRSFTHWLGGFGIVMVFVVLFPTGGRSLFRSEVPGIAREAGHQRVRDSALALMRIYLGISALELVFLLAAGMDLFDSLIHTFGTIATGGFSNRADSVAYYSSFPIELVVTVFMFLCGINFAVYDTLLRVGPRPAWRRVVGSLEARAYFGLTVGATLLIGFVLWFWGGSNGTEASAVPDYRSLGRALRDSLFQVVTILTSTGYATADYDEWPQVCRILLMFLAFVGACAGSTGGGLKVVRFLIVWKAAITGVQRFIRPRAIHQVRMDGQSLDEGVVASVTGYFALWILVFVAGTLFLAAYGIELETGATAVLATLNNIGPGLSGVGPIMNFAELPGLVKFVLSIFMILGRLEFYAVVALLVPGFWRR